MITWNIDLSNYTKAQLEALVKVAYDLDHDIATKIFDYLNETYYKNNN